MSLTFFASLAETAYMVFKNNAKYGMHYAHILLFQDTTHFELAI